METLIAALFALGIGLFMIGFACLVVGVMHLSDLVGRTENPTSEGT